MQEGSRTLSEMQQRIEFKLRAVGANSRDNAVTAQEANFDDPEQNWLCYIAGGLFAMVKKHRTSDITLKLSTRLAWSIPDCVVELCRK